MKPAPTKFSTAKTSTNQRIGNWQEEKYNERQKAIELAKTDFPHLKDKPIRYELSRQKNI